MINRYVEQLKSSDPTRRREAIIALGKSNDLAALKPLADVFRNDPDPVLRELARKAGLYLRQQAGGAEAAASAPAAAAAVGGGAAAVSAAPAAAEPARPAPRRVVKPEDVERSKGYIDEALTYNGRGENGKAIKSLRRAIELNPDIMRDGFFMSVAGAVTGKAGDEAVAFLQDNTQTSAFLRDSVVAKQNQRVSEHLKKADDSTWGAVALESIIFFLINAIAPILLFFVTAELLRNALNSPDTMEALEESGMAMGQLDVLAGLGIGLAFVYGLIVGVSQLVATFIYAGIVHVAARFAFGGKGIYRHYLDVLLSLYNKRLPVYWVLSFIGVALTFGAGVPLFAACVGIIILIFTIWFVLQVVSTTSKAYDFGFAGGCLSNVVAFVLLYVVVPLILQVALGAALSAAFTNLAS